MSYGGLNIPRAGNDIKSQLKEDWDNREYVEVISFNVKKIADFLNAFELSCRSRLAVLNEKLNSIERKIEYLEASITKGETLH
ncbi:unnamed protein product [Soboliphyme baturini]|uniref:BRICK1 n=1 Tax=Soboliphyme baturini TaxID=241478 RepID=A0A183IT34_9BILA|nr:unnamed protein product [Soboliphyme baturini]